MDSTARGDPERRWRLASRRIFVRSSPHESDSGLFAFRLFQCPKMVAYWDSYQEDGSAAARLRACRTGAPWDTYVHAAPGAAANSNIWREMTRWAAGWDIMSPRSSRRPSVI